MESGHKIFALDIGTRSIAGLVMQESEQGYEILDAEMLEHSSRAMLDGQIHDVEAVAMTIAKIKNALEERMQIKLDKAAIAAAGRALKTLRGIARKSRLNLGEISAEEIKALVIEGVQNAQYKLLKEEKDNKNNYFCVGYSVVKNILGNQEIKNLIGQIGNEVEVEVIATFLPKVVVDSLFSALRKAELDIYSMTLEPIAALSVAIPDNMRLLNLALVDIGAGTSDIAIIKDGNIFAYAMVPFGGDEISEFLSNEYLLDFDSAERIKRILSTEETVEITDILGNQNTFECKEIINQMQNIVKELATQIASEILNINQKPPQAVLCIGGGSLTPSLDYHISQALEIAKNRVGLRIRENVDNIKGDFDFLKGPQGVTVLGIAYDAIDRPSIPFITIEINAREIALWNTGETTVGTALLGAGISLSNIFGKPGMGKTIEINGAIRVIKGEMGKVPIIKVNGEESTLETLVKDGDKIFFSKGEDGLDANICLKDFIAFEPSSYKINGEQIEYTPLVLVNGKQFPLEDVLPDRAKVEIKYSKNLYQILLEQGVEKDNLKEVPYEILLNQKEKQFIWSPISAKIDGLSASLKDIVMSGAVIEYQINETKPQIKGLIEGISLHNRINIKVNGEVFELNVKPFTSTMNGKAVSPDEEIINGAEITYQKNITPAILSDIFQVIDLKPNNNTGRLTMRVNGNSAGFTTPIFENANIELFWQE